ncbi:MAG: exodeoxyribonuclease VII large subunit [Ruminococcus sp.]|nr:exodeoxyribonuclease VII large subunit [Ruminococcus sp.]
MSIITVTQLNTYLASVFRGDRNLSNIFIRGEITDVSSYSRGKKNYLFFNLKDSESLVGAVVFHDVLKRLKFKPADGMSVVVCGKVTVYEPRGNYRITVNDIIADGTGKEAVSFEQLKKKLSDEGIFSRKRPVPQIPKKIGVVTSLKGAAVRDIINVISRRYPLAEIYAVNAVVQGETAVESICRGIKKAENCDVVIVGRGGGSAEDLSSFNSEKVARAVYNCKAPVISAVGHETDISLCDMAADLRAPTPSAAAELAVPDINSLYGKIELLERRMKNIAETYLARTESRLKYLTYSLESNSPQKKIELSEQKLNSLEKDLKSAYRIYMGKQENIFSEKTSMLENLSPLKVLARGYSVVYSGEHIIKNSNDINMGDTIKIDFGNGGADAEIKNKW